MHRLIIALLAACVFVLPAPDLALSQSQQTIEDLKAQLDVLNANQRRLEVKILELEKGVGKEVETVRSKDVLEPREPAFPKWSLELDAMWMDLKGLDWHALDVVRYTDVLTTKPSGNIEDDYDYDRASKNLGLDSQPTFRGELTHRLNSKFRVGVSGWFFDSNDSTSGRVTTSSVNSTETLSDGSRVRSTYENWVTMWDANVSPVTNVLEPNRLSPIDYSAKQKFNIWSLDFFASRNFVDGERGFLDMNVGTKISRLNHETQLEQKQHAYRTNYLGYDVYENFITLESTQEAHYSLLTGPSVGFQGRFNIYGPVRFEGFINQSVLFGKVHQRGNFHDVDDIYWRDNGKLIFHDVYDGNAPFKSSQSVAIPVTEIKANLLFDIRKNLALDVGGFFSQWWDMPVAPELRAPWDIQNQATAPSGLNWEETERTLRFVGVTLGITLTH